MESDIRFEETQRFQQPWLWILIVVAVLTPLVLLGFGLYQQLHLGEPWGTNPLSNRGLVVVAVIACGLAMSVLLLALCIRLLIRVDATHLHVHYRPFVTKHIPLAGIARCRVRSYRPLREYGGWGVRWSWTGRGWAYNVSGNRGVQLELADGKRLLIGSCRAEELANTIAKSAGR